jgi:ATP-binding cassette subfamily F protein uup
MEPGESCTITHRPRKLLRSSFFSMAQITVLNGTLRFRGPPLLDDATLRIEAGDKIGLLGRNGAGKTTLLRLLAGWESLESGSVELAPGTRIALVPQDVPQGISGTMEQVIAQGFPPEFDSPELLWKKDQMLERTIAQLQLDPTIDFLKSSTGIRRRALIGRALVSAPDVLLLDEPTNHLDIDSILWMEGFLASIPSTLVFVTHDRSFLTKLAKRIVEVDRGKLLDWSCDYETFLKRKEQALLAQEKQDSLFDKKLAQEEVWIRTGIKARRTRNEGRVRRLEEMRRVRASRQSSLGTMKLAIDSGERSGVLVCDMQKASFGYGDVTIIPTLDLTLLRGDKIGILGRNGVGKSTLLKGILGEIQPSAGSVRMGTKLEIAYFDQTRAVLDMSKTAEENVGVGRTSITVGGRTKHVIGYLQEFLFTPEEARSKIDKFSGGQRNRLLLAKLFAQPANLLVLDEPTNDLDAESLELLEEKLVEYDGTLLVVSHDRTFLNNVVASMLVFEETGIKEYVGGYDDWLRQRSEVSKETKSSAKPESANSKNANGSTSATPKKLSFKEKQEWEGLPAKIETIESELAGFHERLSQPDYFKSPPAELAKDQRRLQELERALELAYARYEELELRSLS